MDFARVITEIVLLDEVANSLLIELFWMDIVFEAATEGCLSVV